jgi:hypothetical protein
MSIENPGNTPEGDKKGEERPLTPEELKALEEIYRVGGITPKDDLEEAPVRIQVDEKGDPKYDVDGSLLLDISDEQSAREAEKFHDFLKETEKKIPGATEIFKEELSNNVRADEITEATLERIRRVSGKPDLPKEE